MLYKSPASWTRRTAVRTRCEQRRGQTSCECIEQCAANSECVAWEMAGGDCYLQGEGIGDNRGLVRAQGGRQCGGPMVLAEADLVAGWPTATLVVCGPYAP